MQGRTAIRLGRVHVSLGGDQRYDALGVIAHRRVGNVARRQGIAVNHSKRKRSENRQPADGMTRTHRPGRHGDRISAESVTLQH